MNGYTPTIGLEIHAELKTKSKMFCGCTNNADEKRPNVNVCPVCMGHPGTLPVLNKEAIKHMIKVGVAVGGTIANFTEWDRKHYFYPDIPKGYQISQYKHPIVSGGSLAGVALTRIHLEEDTAKSFHDQVEGTLVDLIRSGVPILELVTEPVIHDGETAAKFGQELQLLLRTLGVADADMEKGHMRVEVNISVSKDNTLGTKTEIKNINSFKSAQRSIEYEIQRQVAVLEAGEKVVQETRGFDESTGKTISQRKKESSHDYRYFPDPDIPKLYISEIPELNPENIKKELPELPWNKRERLATAYNLKPVEVEILTTQTDIGTYFEEITKELKGNADHIRLATNYLLTDTLGLLKKQGDEPFTSFTQKVPVSNFVELVVLISNATISSRGAKDTLAVMIQEGGKPEEIANRLGVIQKSDPAALEAAIRPIIEANPQVVAEYKAGKEVALQFFVGQGMKATKGSANPTVLKEIILKLIA